MFHREWLSGNIESEEANISCFVSSLLRKARAGNRQTKLEAIRSLGLVGGQEAIAPLVAMIADADVKVQVCVLAALKKLMPRRDFKQLCLFLCQDEDNKISYGRRMVMQNMTNQCKTSLDLEEVYSKALTYARGMMSRYSVPQHIFSAEDIAGEFILQFIKRGFQNKYDPEKSSVNRYVFLGVRNVTINMIRRHYEIASLEEIEEVSGFVPSTKIDPLQALVIDEIIEIVNSIKFGRGKVVLHRGRMYPSNASSVLRLMYEGYNKSEIARLFDVSPPVITQLLKRVRQFFKQLDGDF